MTELTIIMILIAVTGCFVYLLIFKGIKKAGKFEIQLRIKKIGGSEIDYKPYCHINFTTGTRYSVFRDLINNSESCNLSEEELKILYYAIRRDLKLLTNIILTILTLILPVSIFIIFFYFKLEFSPSNIIALILTLFIMLLGIYNIIFTVKKFKLYKIKYQYIKSKKYNAYIFNIDKKLWSIEEKQMRGQKSYIPHYYIKTGSDILKVEKKSIKT